MSESNGYATDSQIYELFGKVQYKDETVMGQKFQLQSLTAEEIQEWLDENEREPATINERLIVRVVAKPQFSMESVGKLSKLHGGFVMKLAKLCSQHAGIQSVGETEKN